MRAWTLSFFVVAAGVAGTGAAHSADAAATTSLTDALAVPKVEHGSGFPARVIAVVP